VAIFENGLGLCSPDNYMMQDPPAHTSMLKLGRTGRCVLCLAYHQLAGSAAKCQDDMSPLSS